MCDELAFGVIEVARERGLRIPDDLSVIGVDNHELSRVLGLTTVDHQVAEHGGLAARSLLGAMAGDPAGDERRPAVTVIERSSVTVARRTPAERTG